MEGSILTVKLIEASDIQAADWVLFIKKINFVKKMLSPIGHYKGYMTIINFDINDKIVGWRCESLCNFHLWRTLGTVGN